MAIYYGDGSNSDNGRQISSHYASYDTRLATTSSSGVNILSINVTPKSTNSRMLITASLMWAANNNDGYINILRGSSNLEISSGNTNRTNSHFGCHYDRTQYDTSRETCVLRDHPNTTSQVTYNVQVYLSGGSSGTLFVNRNGHDNDREFDPEGISFLIVEEFAP